MQFSRNGFNRILSTGFLVVSSFFAYDALGEDSVKGTAIYRERIKLTPSAVFEATLEDVSRADAPSERMGSVRIENPGSPPFRFEISYDPARITANHRYSVRARITVKERLFFTTDRAYPVLTSGHGREVELLLRRAGGSSAREALAPAGLLETYWRPVEIAGKSVTLAPDQREPHFVLTGDGNRVHGSTGCNRITGSFEESTDGLRFNGLATTRMMCPPPIAELEAAFLKALNATTSHRIIGDAMELLDVSGALLMRLEATYLR